MNKESIVGQFNSLIDRGFSVIPVTTFWDDKADGFVGKRPLISEWQKFCADIPEYEDVEEWDILKSTGLGLCVGPASGLCCVDIDEYDEAIKTRLEKALPHTPLKIIGNPQKGGKYIFRTPESFNYDTNMKTIKRNGKSSIEFFFNKKQVVLPPSIHTRNKDGSIRHAYKWDNPENAKLALDNIEDIPVFNMAYIEKANVIISGTMPDDEVDLNSPDVPDGINHMRFDDMKKVLSRAVSDRQPVDKIAITLKKHDHERNNNNLLFSDKTKGFSKDYDTNLMTFIYQTVKNFKEEIKTPPIDAGEITVDGLNFSAPILDKEIHFDDIDILEIPPVAREFCKALSESNGLSVYGCYMLLITCFSPLIGNKRKIQPKNDPWTCHPNIYMSLCQPSGSRKTESLKRAMKFLKEVQKRHDVNYGPKLEAHMRLKERNEFLIKDKEAEVKLLVKEAGLVGEPDQLAIDNIDRLQQEVQKLKKECEPPKKKEFIMGFSTYEKYLMTMSETETGNLMYFEELQELVSNFYKKGNETLRQLIMNSHDGDQKIEKNTKGQGIVAVEPATLSFISATQPRPLSHHLSRVKFSPKEQDGFWHRFNYVFAKRDTSPARDIAFNPDKMGKLQELFHRAYEVETSELPVKVDADAYDYYMNIENEIKQTVGNYDEIYQPFVTKSNSNILSFAYIDSFFREGGDITTVSLESLTLGKKMFKVMLSHVKALFEQAFSDQISDCVQMIKDGDIYDGMTIPNLKKAHPMFSDIRIRTEIVHELLERNLIRVSSNVIETNPNIR